MICKNYPKWLKIDPKTMGHSLFRIQLELEVLAKNFKLKLNGIIGKNEMNGIIPL